MSNTYHHSIYIQKTKTVGEIMIKIYQEKKVLIHISVHKRKKLTIVNKKRGIK